MSFSKRKSPSYISRRYFCRKIYHFVTLNADNKPALASGVINLFSDINFCWVVS